MLPVFGLITATLGLLLILFLIWREEGAAIEGTEKGALAGAAALTVVVGIIQVIQHLPGGGGH